MTDTWVRAVRPKGDKRANYQDENEPSLWLRALPPSKCGRRNETLRTFYFRGSVSGCDVSMRIGAYPATSLAMARETASRLKARFYAEPRWREREAVETASAVAAGQRRRLTVGRLVESFIANERGRVRGQTGARVPGRSLDAATVDWHVHVIGKHILPVLGEVLIEDVRTADVVEILERLGGAGKVKTANVVRRLTSQLFEHARGRLQMDVANPATSLERYAEEPRIRCPTDAEIRALHEYLSDQTQSLSRAVALALRVSMRTAQRIGEVVGAHDSEFNLDAALWLVPGARTKSGRPHNLPLVPQVLALIIEARRSRGAGHEGYVFASPHKLGASITRLACSQGLSRVCRRLEIDAVCPHDFRRMARSLLGREWLDVNPMHAELVLSHSVGSRLQQIYDRHDYVRERRKALAALNTELDRILDSRPIPDASEVIELRA